MSQDLTITRIFALHAGVQGEFSLKQAQMALLSDDEIDFSIYDEGSYKAATLAAHNAFTAYPELRNQLENA